MLGTLRSCSIGQTPDGFSLGTLYGGEAEKFLLLVIHGIMQLFLEENTSVRKGCSHADFSLHFR